MKNKYRNPWHKTLNIPKPEFYENDAPLFHEYRGFQVFKVNQNHFDYVFAGTCITQRAGCKTKQNAEEVINGILNGETPVSDAVLEHLRGQGLKPLEYGEITA